MNANNNVNNGVENRFFSTELREGKFEFAPANQAEEGVDYVAQHLFANLRQERQVSNYGFGSKLKAFFGRVFGYRPRLSVSEERVADKIQIIIREMQTKKKQCEVLDNQLVGSNNEVDLNVQTQMESIVKEWEGCVNRNLNDLLRTLEGTRLAKLRPDLISNLRNEQAEIGKVAFKRQFLVSVQGDVAGVVKTRLNELQRDLNGMENYTVAYEKLSNARKELKVLLRYVSEDNQRSVIDKDDLYREQLIHLLSLQHSRPNILISISEKIDGFEADIFQDGKMTDDQNVLNYVKTKLQTYQNDLLLNNEANNSPEASRIRRMSDLIDRRLEGEEVVNNISAFSASVSYVNVRAKQACLNHQDNEGVGTFTDSLYQNKIYYRQVDGIPSELSTIHYFEAVKQACHLNDTKLAVLQTIFPPSLTRKILQGESSILLSENQTCEPVEMQHQYTIQMVNAEGDQSAKIRMTHSFIDQVKERNPDGQQVVIGLIAYKREFIVPHADIPEVLPDDRQGLMPSAVVRDTISAFWPIGANDLNDPGNMGLIFRDMLVSIDEAGPVNA